MEIKIYCLVLLYIDILVQVSVVIGQHGSHRVIRTDIATPTDVLIIN